jgi:hypothetical protein
MTDPPANRRVRANEPAPEIDFNWQSRYHVAAAKIPSWQQPHLGISHPDAETPIRLELQFYYRTTATNFH